MKELAPIFKEAAEKKSFVTSDCSAMARWRWQQIFCALQADRGDKAIKTWQGLVCHVIAEKRFFPEMQSDSWPQDSILWNSTTAEHTGTWPTEVTVMIKLKFVKK
jgi:hypothetical protein